jgi:hypothetical protein
MEYVIIWFVAAAITLAVTYAIIRAAVRAALFDHYKTVRHFEATGTWRPSEDSWRKPPRPADDTEVPEPPLKWYQR